MNSIRSIKSHIDYRPALAEINSLIDSAPGSENAERLEVISILVADYEDKHEPIGPPDPIDFLEFVMESRGLNRKDMEPYIGSRSRVAEIMNRKRILSLDMIRRLCSGLDLPSDVLIRPYQIETKSSGPKLSSTKIPARV
ncbi:MAG: transcriptional regulator [Chthonomonadales bacterium]